MVTEARVKITKELILTVGFPLTEVARLIGTSPSGVASMLRRIERGSK